MSNGFLEMFTEKAIKVIMLAQEEARRLGHNFVGTEQILLGLLGEGTGIAAQALREQGALLKDARVEVEKIIGRGSGFIAVEIPFTPRAKRVMHLAFNEAQYLGNNFLSTEHLLLGLIHENEGVGARVLENLGVDKPRLRSSVIRAVAEQTLARTKTGQIQPVPALDDPTNKLPIQPTIHTLSPNQAPPIYLGPTDVTEDERTDMPIDDLSNPHGFDMNFDDDRDAVDFTGATGSITLASGETVTPDADGDLQIGPSTGDVFVSFERAEQAMSIAATMRTASVNYLLKEADVDNCAIYHTCEAGMVVVIPNHRYPIATIHKIIQGVLSALDLDRIQD